jgi:predicted DNA-binding transcriptional regulator AlpA
MSTKLEYLNTSGVARLLGISRQAVWQAMKRGTLPEHAAILNNSQPLWRAEQFDRKP